MSFKVYSRWLLTGVALASLAACAADTEEADPTPNPQVNPDPNSPEASNTIVDIASANPDFSLLVSAVVKANLVEVLAGDDALTVFAPSNEAFAASGLDAAAIESLTEDQARQIVLYHAVSGTISSTDLSTGIVSTVSSLSLVVATVDGVELNGGNGISGGAKVVTADLPADNGTLHVIDRVLIPPTIADLDDWRTAWIPAELQSMILVDNPGRVYGFPPVEDT